jgi:GH24 family phage-related lysozyme (muramidase)
MAMSMSSVGKLRLQNREKKIMRYYEDMGKGKGNCTMGIGHLVHKNPCTAEELARKVTDEDVMRGFDSDLRAAENAVNRNVKVSLTQEQFDGLVSYTYNRGPTEAMAAYQLTNAGDLQGAASEMRKRIMVKVKKKGKMVTETAVGLVARRAEESAPFMSTAKQKEGSATK